MNERTMPLHAWSVTYRALSARARASQASRLELVRRLAREAGLDPSMPFLHAHNAVCSANAGRPWRGVNYSLARRINRMDREGYMFAASRIVDRWAARVRPVLPICTLHDARAWVADCAWANLEPDDIDGLTIDQLDHAIARHYDGGIAQFVLDHEHARV